MTCVTNVHAALCKDAYEFDVCLMRLSWWTRYAAAVL